MALLRSLAGLPTGLTPRPEQPSHEQRLGGACTYGAATPHDPGHSSETKLCAAPQTGAESATTRFRNSSGLPNTRRSPTSSLASARSGRLAQDGDLHVPHLIDIEILHALRRLNALGHLSAERASDAHADFRDVAIVRDPHIGLSDRIWELRHTSALTTLRTWRWRNSLKFRS